MMLAVCNLYLTRLVLFSTVVAVLRCVDSETVSAYSAPVSSWYGQQYLIRCILHYNTVKILNSDMYQRPASSASRAVVAAVQLQLMSSLPR
jgi:hypothetical protein